MKKKNPTIKDVAKKCDVGIATVSRVLNNSNKVNEKTRDKILNAIEEIGYSPNFYARSLSSKKIYSLSFILPDIGNDFYGLMYKKLESILSEKNYRLVVFPLVDQVSLQKIKQKTDIMYQTDAVFLASLSIKNIFKNNIPNKKIILIDSYDNRFDSVYIKNNKIGEIAAEYLMKKYIEESEFYLVTFKELENEFTSHVFYNRDMSYINLLAKFKIKPKIIYADLFWDGGYKAAEKFINLKSNKKKLIFTTCDMLGFGVKTFLDKNNLIPNFDYNLISIDDIPISSVIGLTTIKQPITLMVEKASDMFFSYLSGRKTIENIELKSELIIRDT